MEATAQMQIDGMGKAAIYYDHPAVPLPPRRRIGSQSLIQSHGSVLRTHGPYTCFCTADDVGVYILKALPRLGRPTGTLNISCSPWTPHRGSADGFPFGTNPKLYHSIDQAMQQVASKH